MRSLTVRTVAVAVAVLAAAALLGYDVIDVRGRIALAVVVGLFFFAGIIVARWWIAALVLVWPALMLFGERCVTTRVASDFITEGCSRVYASDLPVLVGVTLVAVAAGFALARVTFMRPAR